MKRCTLYVNGNYPKQQLDFYKQFCHKRYKVAVDGGYDFFCKANLIPDLLIGDFDSVKQIPTNLPATTSILQFPRDKDKTDLHLAVDYCLKQGANDIDIVNPIVGDIDHFLSTIFLLASQLIIHKKKLKKLRLLSHTYEARFVHNSTTVFQNCNKRMLSVLPLSSSIKLSCTGTAFPAKNLKINFGDSHSLRNSITGKRAVVQIKGSAIVIVLR